MLWRDQDNVAAVMEAMSTSESKTSRSVIPVRKDRFQALLGNDATQSVDIERYPANDMMFAIGKANPGMVHGWAMQDVYVEQWHCGRMVYANDLARSGKTLIRE